jgi:hypothetical protein
MEFLGASMQAHLGCLRFGICYLENGKDALMLELTATVNQNTKKFCVTCPSFEMEDFSTFH